MNAVLHLGYTRSSVTGAKKLKYSNQRELVVATNIEKPWSSIQRKITGFFGGEGIVSFRVVLWWYQNICR